MKRVITAIAALAVAATATAQWKIAGDLIRTKWAEEINPDKVLQEYPRPKLQREQWLCLNGLWDYSITPASDPKPELAQGKILVPFPVESALSGVMREVTPKDAVWYDRDFTVPAAWKGKNVLLNFGAVDWKADVYVNGVMVLSHTGGYTPFSVDITDALLKGTKQHLTVRVWDPSNLEDYPCGKQRFNPHGIWYTPVSGIWQTVWIEPVASQNHIEEVLSQSNLRRGEVTLQINAANNTGTVDVQVLENGKCVLSTSARPNMPFALGLEKMHLWDTEDPFLYTVKATLRYGDKCIDSVESYMAIREFTSQPDKTGNHRIFLNGKPLFLYGPLDQGWWPDGLYTAPSDEALLYDVEMTKKFGFNSIRKHIKVEPDRWYYHCDRLGMVVWQDMPSICNWDGAYWGRNIMNGGTDRKFPQYTKDNFYKEWGEIISALRFHPSIGIWVPFNEAWSQFDTEYTAEWTKAQDPTRLVNAASGGNLRECGDIIDIHNYPAPALPVKSAERITVLGEYGGIGRPVKDHLWWNDKRNWGYVQFSSLEAVTDEYVKYAKMIIPFIPQGMSAAIYTQTTDVEGEVNGLMTYDRKVIKLDVDRVAEVNREVIKALSE